MELFSSWTGSDFLLFYIMLLGLSGVAAWWWIPVQLRPAGRRGDVLDAEDLAVLAGGRNRFADSLLADLFVRGGLAGPISGKLEVVQRAVPASPAGKVLLAHGGLIALGDAHKVLAAHAERVSARLRRSGLLMHPDEVTRLSWLSVAPFIVLLLIGIYRQRAGSALGEPTGYLVVLLLLTVALGLLRFFTTDQRTRAGIAVLAAERARASRLSRAPQPDEVATAVALFGTGVLVGTPWEPVHAMRQQAGSSDSGGSSDNSGDSDGGGDGGGCGGCGG